MYHPVVHKPYNPQRAPGSREAEQHHGIHPIDRRRGVVGGNTGSLHEENSLGNYARYADDHFQQAHAQDRRLHEHRLRQVFPDWDEIAPEDQEVIRNQTYRTHGRGVGVGHPTDENKLQEMRQWANDVHIEAQHEFPSDNRAHAADSFDESFHSGRDPEEARGEWNSHVDRVRSQAGAHHEYNLPEELPGGFEEPTQAWHEHVRRANKPTQAARYAKTDYHGRLCRLREKLASLREPTMYDDEMMEDGGGMDEMDGGVDYADNVSGIGQDERHGYSSGMADQTRMMRAGHGPF